MALKTFEELLEELTLAVRNGENGKTTADSLREFLKSFIVELTTSVMPPGGSSVDIKSTDSINLTKDTNTKAIKADLIYSDTTDIALRVNPSHMGLQAGLPPILRSSLPIYIGAANDGRFLFHGAKTYAFASASQAVAYVYLNGMKGIFVFRADITEPIELLNDCTYDIAGFDSVINGGSSPNFQTKSSVGSCRTSVKIRRIIRNGDATGEAVAVKNMGTDALITGDIRLDSSSGTVAGIKVTNGAKLRYRGNIEAIKNAQFVIQQGEGDCVTDFAGNILTQVDMNGTSIWCNGGMFDFTGRIDMLGSGIIAQYRVLTSGNSLMRLNLLGATSKGYGLWILVYFNTSSARFYVNGVIDMRESKFVRAQDASGLHVGSSVVSVPVAIQFENLTILTKKGIKPVDFIDAPGINKISVIGDFYTTENPNINGVTFEKNYSI